MYNIAMSNLTDGKKALAAGEFATAEKKLLKALDLKPDDSELWWCLMLCRYGYTDDAALTAGLKAEFIKAADAGDNIPETPFDSTYCKNALLYSRDGKRRAFTERVNAELSELWREKTGRAVVLKVKEQKLVTRADVLSRCCYAAIAPAAIGAVMTVFGAFTVKLWAAVLGAVLTVAGLVVMLLLRYKARKAGKTPKGVFAAMFTVLAFICIGLYVSGLITANAHALRAAFAALVITAIAACALLFMRTRRRARETHASARTASAKRGGQGKKAAYDRSYFSAATADERSVKKAAKKSLTEVKKNEYQDTFD